jgi:hypothetical protein
MRALSYSKIFASVSDIVKTEIHKDTDIKTFKYLWDKRQLQNDKCTDHCIFVVADEMEFLSLKKTDASYNFLLLSDKPYKKVKALFAKSNIAVMTDDSVDAKKKVFTAIQNACNGDDYIAKSMMKIMYFDRAEFAIQALLQEMSGILQNPLTVVDTTLGKVAESCTDKVKGVSRDPLKLDYGVLDYINDILNKKESPAAGSIMDRKMVVDNLRYTSDRNPDSGVFIWIGDSIADDNVISWLLSHKNLFGYLFMSCNVRPITPADLKIFEFCSIVIANKMWTGRNEAEDKYGTHKLITFNALLANICSGALTNAEKILKKVKAFDVRLKKGFILICIRAENDERLSFRFENEWRQLIDPSAEGYMFNVDKHYAILFSLDDPFKNRDKISSSFDALLKKNKCIGAISRSFFKITNLKERYDVVNDFLDISESFGAKPGICKMEDYLFHHIIHAYSEKYDPKILTHVIIDHLKSMNKSGVDYYETFRVYIESDRDMVKASKKLFLHYNTLRYRIHKICEETNINLDDWHMVFWIRLSFYIDDIINQLDQ